MPKISQRIKDADYVFYAMNTGTKLPESILNYIPSDKLYIVGNKNYGESNGIIYARRGSANYFYQKVKLPYKMISDDIFLAKTYGDHYISLIEPITTNGLIQVFTNKNKYISQDCRHLMQAGAQYYAKILNIKIRKILGK